MKKNGTISLLVFQGVLASILVISNPAHSQEVLVYHGPGNCDEGCAGAAAKVARRVGLSPRFIPPSRINAATLSKAKLWIQPGGDAIEVANNLTAQQKSLLQNFVREGGSYIGFCAGAFLADRTVDDANIVQGLDLLAGTTYDFLPDLKGIGTLLPIIWEGQLRQIYFEDGPGFRMLMGAQYETMAVYPDGTPAVISYKFGKGRVVLSGVHPESPLIWKRDNNLNDSDGSDLDLADQMLERALDLNL